MCISLCVRRERVIAIVLLRVIGSCSVLCDTVFNRLQQLRDRFLGLTEQIAFTACMHALHAQAPFVCTHIIGIYNVQRLSWYHDAISHLNNKNGKRHRNATRMSLSEMKQLHM